MPSSMTPLMEIGWDFGDVTGPNWMYCNEHATFSHRDACEFIIHIGPAQEGSRHWEFVVDEMKVCGCTQDFIQAYLDAKDAGAVRVMFWC